MFLAIAGPGRAWAASTTAEQALKLAPIQDGVDYDRPTPEEAAKCKISVKKRRPARWAGSWKAPKALILRKFIDTNGDNVVDQWSYYKDGVEVYRDIDSDFNGKVDQYRWLNTGGTRWGIDKRDANRIGTARSTTGKSFPPEEVTAEVVAALAKQDVERFSRLLLTPDELQSLGLGRAKTEALAAKIAQGGGRFQAPCSAGRTASRRRREMGAVRRHQAGRRAGRRPTARARTCRSTKTSLPSCRPAARAARCRSAR